MFCVLALHSEEKEDWIEIKTVVLIFDVITRQSPSITYHKVPHDSCCVEEIIIQKILSASLKP